MRMKLTVLIISILVLWPMQAIAQEQIENVDELGELEQQLYEYAVTQAQNWEKAVWDSQTMKYIYPEEEEKFEEYLREMKEIGPEKVWVSMPGEKFDEEYYLKGDGIAKDFHKEGAINEHGKVWKHTACFEVIRRTEDFELNYGLHLFESMTSIYDVVEIDGFEDVAYVALLYGDDLPMMVTAFSEVEEGMAITKTSLVYMEPMSEFKTQLLTIRNGIWGDEKFVTYIYDVPENSADAEQ